MRQASLERAPGRSPPGRIAVETENDRVGLAQQLLHVNRRARGAERRDRVREPELGERDDVHVALHDQHVLALANREPRLQAEPYSSLPLLNSGVSGEFRYFGSPLPSTRPPKPITCPFTLRIGNMIRSRNRS